MDGEEVFTSEAFDRDRFTMDVSDSLCCVVCLSVPTRGGARQCSSENQHLLCVACAGRICGGVALCPMCRCALPRSVEELQRPSRLVRNMYDDLFLACCHCDDTIAYTSIDEHEKKCIFGPYCVPCCFTGCAVEIPRHRLARHLQQCPKRIVFCKNCHLPFSYEDLARHTVDGCAVPKRFRLRRQTSVFGKYTMPMLIISIGALLVGFMFALMASGMEKDFHKPLIGS